jgi:hypothetical protein
MKKQLLSGCLIILIALPASLSAEIYKYTDENGQQRWTDDLSQIPIEQRTDAQRLEGVTEGTEDSDEAVDQGEESQTGTEATEPGDSADAEGLSRETLESEKADLDSLYQELLEERKALEEIKSGELDDAGRADLNSRIEAFNTKTEQYESQLDAFNEKVNAFNQKAQAERKKKGD